MSKQRVIFLFGIWIAILPFLGFPNFWRKILFFITGMFLVYISYTLRKKITTQPKHNNSNPFKDNLNDQQ